MNKAAMIAMGLMLLTGLVGVGAAWGLPPRPAWFMLGFEALVALTGAMGLVWARSETLSRSSLMPLCVGGVCLLMSLLGYLSVKGQLGGYGLKPWVAFRGLLALTLGIAAMVNALDGHRDLWRMLGRGVAAGMLLLVGSAVTYHFRGTLGNINGPARLALTLVGLAAAGVLLCYAGHVIIRAFQIAQERRASGGSGPGREALSPGRP
jgi:hypothetical protein